MQTKINIIGFVIVGVFALGILDVKTVSAGYEQRDENPLLKMLPSSKLSLAEGIGQAAKGSAVAISAKFELDDGGKLSLSVYLCQEGLAADAEHAVFKEVAGDPTAEKWNPQSKVIQDVNDLNAAKDQLKVLSGSKFSLLDFISMAQKDQKGMVFSVTPMTENQKNFCEVRMSFQGKIITLRYDATGDNGQQKSQAVNIAIDFSKYKIGRLPEDISTDLLGIDRLSKWEVIDADGKNVLAQFSTDKASMRFPLCIYEPIQAKDIEISVRFKTVSGRIDHEAGLLARYQNKDNYYVARVNTLKNNVHFYKVQTGKLKQIAAADLKVTPDQWHILKLEIKGTDQKVYCDGKLLIETNDTAFQEAGKAGLWTKAQSITYFDDLRIKAWPE